MLVLEALVVELGALVGLRLHINPHLPADGNSTDGAVAVVRGTKASGGTVEIDDGARDGIVEAAVDAK